MNDRIKKIREYFGLKQEEMGNRLGLTKNYIYLVETGKRNLSEQSIRILCSEFNVSREWLLTGIGEMFYEKTKDEKISEMLGNIENSSVKDFKYRLVSALSKLNKSEWEMLENLVESIAGKEK